MEALKRFYFKTKSFPFHCQTNISRKPMWRSRGDRSHVIFLNPIFIWTQLREHSTGLNLPWQAAGRTIASAGSSDTFVAAELYSCIQINWQLFLFLFLVLGGTGIKKIKLSIFRGSIRPSWIKNSEKRSNWDIIFYNFPVSLLFVTALIAGFGCLCSAISRFQHRSLTLLLCHPMGPSPLHRFGNLFEDIWFHFKIMRCHVLNRIPGEASKSSIRCTPPSTTPYSKTQVSPTSALPPGTDPSPANCPSSKSQFC